jgi:tRNA pseudouridine13 synthase
MIDPHWLEAALDPPRAHGASLGRGRVRVEPEDFIVEEDLGFEPSGSGQHALVKVRKRNANTEWVARALARFLGCRPHDVGFAGLKDRRAVTIQSFSVPNPSRAPIDWSPANIEGCEILESQAHSRKLPRGALAGNRFVIRIRDVEADSDALHARLEAIRARGVPNYFGPQRFGRDAGNLAQLDQPISSWHPRDRGFFLSAARSLIFNAVLAERVREGSWDRLENGDVANLEGTGSIFPVTAVDAELRDRALRFDVHPTAPLWGAEPPRSEGRIHELETKVADSFPIPRELTVTAGMRQERRALRMAVRDLNYERLDGDLILNFRLGKGSFATTVLRELIDASLGEEGD